MKTFFKIICSIALFFCSLLLIVGLFSIKETNFRCEGTLPNSNAVVDAYVRWSEYRWWVGLWSESSGEIYLEIPNRLVFIETETRKVGPQIQIWSSKGELLGNFSALSGTLALQTPLGFLDAKCIQAG